MPAITSAFKPEYIAIDKTKKLFIIELEELSPKIVRLFNHEIVSICFGRKSRASIREAKDKIIAYLHQKDKDKKMGSIAEFILHCFLNEQNLKQQCLFLNLEENSAKKGFDGYYTSAKLQWLLESKSGSFGPTTSAHRVKVRESYADLKKKVEGKVTNNPWANAYNHISHYDVGGSRKIAALIEQFSKDFAKKKYKDIADFNVIAGGTIFFNGSWRNMDQKTIEEDIKKLTANWTCQRANVICVTKKSVNQFLRYLNS